MEITPGEISLTGGPFLYRLMVVNLMIGIFNLLPAFPMDGGRVLRAVLALQMDHNRATQKAASIGQFLAVGLGLLGILYNPFLVFIALFIWFGATMESSAEQLKSILGSATVKHAMLTEFHILSPEDTLSKAVDLTLAGSQKDFPVGYPDQLYKVLLHNDLLKGLQRLGANEKISHLPLQDIHSADINEPLAQLLERMQGNPTQLVCVTDNQKIVGLVNLDNILELIKIQEAMRLHHR